MATVNPSSTGSGSGALIRQKNDEKNTILGANKPGSQVSSPLRDLVRSSLLGDASPGSQRNVATSPELSSINPTVDPAMGGGLGIGGQNGAPVPPTIGPSANAGGVVSPGGLPNPSAGGVTGPVSPMAPSANPRPSSLASTLAPQAMGASQGPSMPSTQQRRQGILDARVPSARPSLFGSGVINAGDDSPVAATNPLAAGAATVGTITGAGQAAKAATQRSGLTLGKIGTGAIAGAEGLGGILKALGSVLAPFMAGSTDLLKKASSPLGRSSGVKG